MSPTIEELDYCQTVLGELILRRRRPVSMPDQWVYEVRLDGHFLMSSLVHFSEVELAERTLRRLEGDGFCVLVGGLGLGHTAAAVLASERVETLEVVELLPQVIDWHRRELVPLAADLLKDPRCRIVQGDCFQWLRSAPQHGYDAVMIDIDDGPEELLSDDHREFYTVAGLRGARRCLQPGGVLGLWTSRPCAPRFLQRLQRAFDSADAEEVEFRNALLDLDDVNTIYLARA